METKRIVVLGTGFAAFSFIKDIHVETYDLTVVSMRNHFLFTPLLPSTTVGTLEFRSIIEPIRTAKPAIRFYLAKCREILADRKLIRCTRGIDKKPFELPFDLLVIAVGADNNTYGIKGVSEHACFLKELEDARAIRQKVIACFEQASAPGIGDDEIKRLMHFVVVGGGPTGIEFAAELHDFIRDALKWFPGIDEYVRITVVEASGEILPSFDSHLRDYARKVFRRERIEVRTETKVEEVRETELLLSDGETLPCGLVTWATGIGPRPLIKSVSLAKDDHGHLLVNEFLQVKGHEDIYALGDCAGIAGQRIPATAQTAQRQGAYLAKALNRSARGRKVKPFSYRNMGMLAYIGGRRALADTPYVKGGGFSTWLLWRSAYITKLVSIKNKVLVLFDWFKTALFGRDISRF